MNSPQPFDKDKLGRKPDADLLTALIRSEPRPNVISVDAPWGGGKTTFLDMWSADLRLQGHPTIRYNAWELDFVDDPLVSFVGELEQELASGVKTPALTRQWERLKSLGVGVIRSTGPLALRIATQGLLSVQDVRNTLGFVASSDEAISDYVAKLTEDRLASYGAEKKAIAGFRESLTTVAAELTSQEGRKPPLIIFVDELDRCRPLYTIALLERIKHLFTVDNIVFVLALDRTQLAHTVRAVYGSGFAAEGYLRRFIDFDYRLPPPRGEAFVQFLAEKHELSKIYSASRASGDEYSEVVPLFSQLSQIFELSLRDQEQAFQRMVMALKSATKPEQYLFTPLVLFLSIFRMAESELHHRYLQGRLGIRDIITTVKNRRGGVDFLDSHGGRVTLAYLIGSARKGSDAKAYLEELAALEQSPAAEEGERYHAANVRQLVQFARQSGARAAMQIVLERLERISEQVQADFY
jgi:hypothetical protein